MVAFSACPHSRNADSVDLVIGSQVLAIELAQMQVPGVGGSRDRIRRSPRFRRTTPLAT